MKLVLEDWEEAGRLFGPAERLQAAAKENSNEDMVHHRHPEDVGGLPGFEMFLDAMADPTHEEHHRLRERYGGPYNPDDIDERLTRRSVAAIAGRRYAGKIAYLKSRAQ